MSSLYNLEPQPTASLIVHTTSGDLALELFAQQTPLTCRNFLQLCLDGYYDDTVFHRLVPGFILQGGDPTGTGEGGESIFDGGEMGEVWDLEERKGRNKPQAQGGGLGVGFKDEFHSRLKFNRRGLLGMANEGVKDSNGSQFFLTLGKTEELTGRNTLFGRVAAGGDTIYNLVRWGEGEVGEGERPVYPVKVKGMEVLVNPFEGMVGRRREAEKIVSKDGDGARKEKKKGKRKMGKQLLSFGGAEDEDGEDDGLVVKKAKFDTRITVDVNEEDEGPRKVETSAKEMKKRVARKPASIDSSPEPRIASTPPTPPMPFPTRTAQPAQREISSSSTPEPVQKMSSLLERTNAQISELKLSMRRTVPVVSVKEEKKSALESMIPATSVRGRKRHPGGNPTSATDQRSLDILKAFREKLEQAPPEKEEIKKDGALDDTGEGGDARETRLAAADDEEDALCDLHFIANCQSCKTWEAKDEGDEDDDEDGEAWLSHALSFKEDKLGKDLRYRKKAEEELVVIDPREKARTLKEEVKARREAKAGGSGRAWDVERNEKLARKSQLAGRGAK